MIMPRPRGSVRPASASHVPRIAGLVVASLAPLCGCAARDASPKVRPDGVVWVFPGVLAGSWRMAPACQGFRDAGVKSEIRVNEWDRPVYDMLAQLTDLEANRAMAARVAGQIAADRERDPAAQIDLVGYSAGGGVALLVAEALPENVHVRSIILAQPAVDPKHDLTRALQHVDGQLVNLYAPHDWFVLDAGTKALGTVDRQYVASAGKVAFDLAAAVPDEALRSKVVQVSWRPEMIWAGHIGSHLGILSREWNKRYVAPYLLTTPESPPAPQPSTATVAADK